MTSLIIPSEHARTILHALCIDHDRAVCTLSAATQQASAAISDWAAGDARDPIPGAMITAIESGHVRPDASWSRGACGWLVDLLHAAESQ